LANPSYTSKRPRTAAAVVTKPNQVIALASDYASACGAYDEAVKRQPGKLITLRQKARVI
jgi:hypothetical protein